MKGEDQRSRCTDSVVAPVTRATWPWSPRSSGGGIAQARV